MSSTSPDNRAHASQDPEALPDTISETLPKARTLINGAVVVKYIFKVALEAPITDYPRGSVHHLTYDSRQKEEIEIILDEELLLEQRLATFEGMLAYQNAMMQTWKDDGSYYGGHRDYIINRSEEEKKQYRAAVKAGKKLRQEKEKPTAMLWCNQCTTSYPGLCDAPSCKNKLGCERHHFPREECFAAYWQAADRGIELNMSRGLLTEEAAFALRALMKSERLSRSYAAVSAFGNLLGACVLLPEIEARKSDKLVSRVMASAVLGMSAILKKIDEDDKAMVAFGRVLVAWAYEAERKGKTEE